MSKKNRVVASITIHVTENGTYKVGEVVGELRRHRHDLTWAQASQVIKEFRKRAALIDAEAAQKAAGDAHLKAIQDALKLSFPTFHFLADKVPASDIEWNPPETFTIGSVSGSPLILKGFWLKP